MNTLMCGLHFFRVRGWRGELHGREAQAFAWQRIESIDVAPLLPANGPILDALAIPETYGITGFAASERPRALAAVDAALRNGLRLIQVRGKDWPAEVFADYAREIVSRAKVAGARVLINGDIGLAQRCGADGVHLTSRQLHTLLSPTAMRTGRRFLSQRGRIAPGGNAWGGFRRARAGAADADAS